MTSSMKWQLSFYIVFGILLNSLTLTCVYLYSIQPISYDFIEDLETSKQVLELVMMSAIHSIGWCLIILTNIDCPEFKNSNKSIIKKKDNTFLILITATCTTIITIMYALLRCIIDCLDPINSNWVRYGLFTCDLTYDNERKSVVVKNINNNVKETIYDENFSSILLATTVTKLPQVNSSNLDSYNVKLIALRQQIRALNFTDKNLFLYVGNNCLSSDKCFNTEVPVLHNTNIALCLLTSTRKLFTGNLLFVVLEQVWPVLSSVFRVSIANCWALLKGQRPEYEYVPNFNDETEIVNQPIFVRRDAATSLIVRNANGSDVFFNVELVQALLQNEPVEEPIINSAPVNIPVTIDNVPVTIPLVVDNVPVTIPLVVDSPLLSQNSIVTPSLEGNNNNSSFTSQSQNLVSIPLDSELPVDSDLTVVQGGTYTSWRDYFALTAQEPLFRQDDEKKIMVSESKTIGGGSCSSSSSSRWVPSASASSAAAAAAPARISSASDSASVGASSSTTAAVGTQAGTLSERFLTDGQRERVIYIESLGGFSQEQEHLLRQGSNSNAIFQNLINAQAANYFLQESIRMYFFNTVFVPSMHITNEVLHFFIYAAGARNPFNILDPARRPFRTYRSGSDASWLLNRDEPFRLLSPADFQRLTAYIEYPFSSFYSLQSPPVTGLNLFDMEHALTPIARRARIPLGHLRTYTRLILPRIQESADWRLNNVGRILTNRALQRDYVKIRKTHNSGSWTTAQIERYNERVASARRLNNNEGPIINNNVRSNIDPRFTSFLTTAELSRVEINLQPEDFFESNTEGRAIARRAAQAWLRPQNPDTTGLPLWRDFYAINILNPTLNYLNSIEDFAMYPRIVTGLHPVTNQPMWGNYTRYRSNGRIGRPAFNFYDPYTHNILDAQFMPLNNISDLRAFPELMAALFGQPYNTRNPRNMNLVDPYLNGRFRTVMLDHIDFIHPFRYLLGNRNDSSMFDRFTGLTPQWEDATLINLGIIRQREADLAVVPQTRMSRARLARSFGRILPLPRLRFDLCSLIVNDSAPLIYRPTNIMSSFFHEIHRRRSITAVVFGPLSQQAMLLNITRNFIPRETFDDSLIERVIRHYRPRFLPTHVNRAEISYIGIGSESSDFGGASFIYWDNFLHLINLYDNLGLTRALTFRGGSQTYMGPTFVVPERMIIDAANGIIRPQTIVGHNNTNFDNDPLAVFHTHLLPRLRAIDAEYIRYSVEEPTLLTEPISGYDVHRYPIRHFLLNCLDLLSNDFYRMILVRSNKYIWFCSALDLFIHANRNSLTSFEQSIISDIHGFFRSLPGVFVRSAPNNDSAGAWVTYSHMSYLLQHSFRHNIEFLTSNYERVNQAFRNVVETASNFSSLRPSCPPLRSVPFDNHWSYTMMRFNNLRRFDYTFYYVDYAKKCFKYSAFSDRFPTFESYFNYLIRTNAIIHRKNPNFIKLVIL